MAADRGPVVQRRDVLGEFLADVVAAHRDRDRRLEIADRSARIEALDLAEHAVERRAGGLDAQRVGELDLADSTGLELGDLVEDVGRENVATDDDEIARGVGGIRLLDHSADGDDAVGIDG